MSAYLFVYGTLRQQLAPATYQQHFQHYAQFIDFAQFQGKLFLVDLYPGAIDSHNTTDQITGELYWLQQPHITLPLLDDYEECNNSYPSPTEYVRQLRHITTHHGKNYPAWIYLYHHPTEHLIPIDCGDFVYFASKTPALAK